MRHVIIGNSAAAVGAIEAIRQHDHDSPITVVADEAHHVYSCPLISYLLGRKVDQTRKHYRSAEFYDCNGVEAMLGVEVVSVTPEESSISLKDGTCSLSISCLSRQVAGRSSLLSPAQTWRESSHSRDGMTFAGSKPISRSTLSSPHWWWGAG